MKHRKFYIFIYFILKVVLLACIHTEPNCRPHLSYLQKKKKRKKEKR